MDETPLIYVVRQDDGRVGADFSRLARSLVVDEHVKKATKITLVLLDDTGTLRDGEGLREGDTVVVRWGTVGRMSRPRGGIVHKIAPSYTDDTVTVEAYGRELALAKGAVRRYFRGGTLRQAIEALGRDHGFAVDFAAEDTIQFDGMVLDAETPWRWLQRQTAALGLEVDFDGQTVRVREPPLGDRPRLRLHYRWRNAELLDWSVETHTKKGEKEDEGVVAVFTDPASGEALTHAAGSPNTTRATLARQRLQAARRTTQAAETRAVAAYVADHDEFADATPAAQRAAWQASLTAQRAAGARPTQDQPAQLVEVHTGDENDLGTLLASLTGTNAGGTTAPPTETTGAREPATVPAPTSAARSHMRRLPESRFRHHERGKVTAKATALGDSRLAKGMVVEVVGVAQRDAGLWYVTEARHAVGDGYVTELELSRDGVNKKGGRASSAARPNTATATPTNTAAASPGTSTQDLVAVDLRSQS